MASNLSPTWPPRRPKIRKNGSKKLPCSSHKRVRNTDFNFNTVLDRLGLDFGGSWGGFWDPRRPQDPPKTPLRRPEPPPRRPQTPQRRPNRLQDAKSLPRPKNSQKQSQEQSLTRDDPKPETSQRSPSNLLPNHKAPKRKHGAAVLPPRGFSIKTDK